MPTVKAWRPRGRKKYHKTGTLLFLHARQSSKIQSTPERRAWTESLCGGGPFCSGNFGIESVGVRLWRVWTCVAARGLIAWDLPL